jgi:hypothetical protein
VAAGAVTIRFQLGEGFVVASVHEQNPRVKVVHVLRRFRIQSQRGLHRAQRLIRLARIGKNQGQIDVGLGAVGVERNRPPH